MKKRPRDDKELRRIVREMAMIQRWQPGALDNELDAAVVATILHRFGAAYVTPPRMREMMSRPVDAEGET